MIVAAMKTCGLDRAGAKRTEQMSAFPGELRELIESGTLAHLSTINADGSPRVCVHAGWH